MHDWQEVVSEEGSNAKANAYQSTMTTALDAFFPPKTTKRKSTELPWMNKRIKKMIKDRKRIFFEEGGKRMADYFIKVSREFEPLEPADIPVEKPAGGKVLACHEVSTRLKK